MKKSTKTLGSIVLSAVVTLGGISFFGSVKAAKGDFAGKEKFESHKKSILVKLKKSKKLMKFPLYRQAASHTSGVSCVQSILRYAKYDFDIREDNLGIALGTDEKNGTNPEMMVGFLNAVRLDETERKYFDAKFKKHMTVSDLVKEIKNDHPVICEMQAWEKDKNGDYSMKHDYSKKWKGRHWALAVGYDEYNIIFMDPSTSGSYTYIPKSRLAQRWHARDLDKNNKPMNVINGGIIVDIKMDNPDGKKYADAVYGLM